MGEVAPMSKPLREFQSALIKQAYVQAVKTAGEFTPAEWAAHKKEHPGADVSDHTITKPEGHSPARSEAKPESRLEAKPKKESKPKAKTYTQAQSDLQDHLAQSGWKVTKGLKVPYAQKGDVRLWFKPQAIHFTKGNKHSLGDARTLTYDTAMVKKMSPADFTSWVEKQLKD
jgi:hypothetical protein